MAEPKKKNTLEEDLDFALTIITDATRRGHKFSNAQMDTMVRAMLPVFEDEAEREWIVEIAEQNRVPLWMALFAQWRRSQESGISAALLLDVEWEKMIEPVVVAAVDEVKSDASLPK